MYQKYELFFADLTKDNLIHLYQTAIVVLAVAIFFLFDNLGEKRSVLLTK